MSDWLLAIEGTPAGHQLALVLALDVSSSVDSSEDALQRGGLDQLVAVSNDAGEHASLFIVEDDSVDSPEELNQFIPGDVDP